MTDHIGKHQKTITKTRFRAGGLIISTRALSSIPSSECCLQKDRGRTSKAHTPSSIREAQKSRLKTRSERWRPSSPSHIKTQKIIYSKARNTMPSVSQEQGTSTTPMKEARRMGTRSTQTASIVQEWSLHLVILPTSQRITGIIANRINSRVATWVRIDTGQLHIRII